jgi:hypothetical protein
LPTLKQLGVHGLIINAHAQAFIQSGLASAGRLRNRAK